MKIRLIAFAIFLVFGFHPSDATVVHTKPKIKNLDLSFSCDANRVKTIDECYYSGIQELNQMGCHLSGEVTSSNCDASIDQVNLDSGESHVKKEWVCSVASTNCKEQLSDPCKLGYREVNRFQKTISGSDKVFLNFLSYCVLDPSQGRKDPTQIRQNEPLEAR